MSPTVPTTVPNVTFKTRVRDESREGENPFRWQDLTSEEIFGDRRVVLFALPGAFTPTCSSTHLPGYEEKYDEIVSEGIDEIYCLSVNDAFVMNKWAEHLGIQKVKMLPDGSCTFTKDMGMCVKKDNLGFGERSWRYSMVVDDHTIEKIFIEEGYEDNCEDDPFDVSDAETMLSYLRSARSG